MMAVNPQVRFRAILADPPWRFKTWSDRGQGRGPRYQTEAADYLERLPISDVCAHDAVLFVWTCWPHLQQALRLIDAWSFTYKTLAFDWVKVTGDGDPRLGLGYWTRANSEPCLLATRGKPTRIDKGVSQVIVSGLGDHSEKPEAQYERIERLVAGPYLELFARPRNGLFPPHKGWEFLGNAVDGRDITDSLHALAAGMRQAADQDTRVD